MPPSLRRRLRLLVADLAHHSGLLELQGPFRRSMRGAGAVCVLGFHRVLSEEALQQSASLAGIVLKEETFARILEHLSRKFQVLSLTEFLDGPAGHSTRPLCLLTFDDGWEDNYTTAYPWLKKFQMPATILATTGWIGNAGGSWVERLRRALAEPARRRLIQASFRELTGGRDAGGGDEEMIERLKRKPSEERERILRSWLPPEPAGGSIASSERMLTWAQIQEMSRNGMEFGAHTVTHPLLTYEEDNVVESELTQSKQALEAALEKKVRAFAYPNGDWDERVWGWVQRAGYECAFTTRRGWHAANSDPYTIRRILLHEGNVTGLDGRFSPAAFAFTVTGAC